MFRKPRQNKFPTVETYREQIDGRYWFPTYSYADEELLFDNGDVLHIRLKVRYTDFELARAKVKIIEADEVRRSEETADATGKHSPQAVIIGSPWTQSGLPSSWPIMCMHAVDQPPDVFIR